ESCLHILFGKGQRLLGDFAARTRDGRHRFARGVKEHSERLFRLIDGLFGELTQFGRDFQFRFDHGRYPPISVRALARLSTVTSEKRRTDGPGGRSRALATVHGMRRRRERAFPAARLEPTPAL